MRKTIFTVMVLCMGLVSACEQTYVPQKPQINFGGTPYVLNVATINIVEDYRSSKELPNVEKLADITPAEAVRQWAAARLVAGGKTGYAEVVIDDAHIIRKELPKQKTGIEGYFTSEQTEEYDGALEVEIKIYDERHTLPVASIHVTSGSSRTIGENATLVDRSNTYHDISVELIKLLETELDKNIRQHFTNYIL